MEEEDIGGGFERTGGLGRRDVKEAVRAHTLATNIIRHLHLYNSPLVRIIGVAKRNLKTGLQPVRQNFVNDCIARR